MTHLGLKLIAFADCSVFIDCFVTVNGLKNKQDRIGIFAIYEDPQHCHIHFAAQNNYTLKDLKSFNMSREDVISWWNSAGQELHANKMMQRGEEENIIQDIRATRQWSQEQMVVNVELCEYKRNPRKWVRYMLKQYSLNIDDVPSAKKCIWGQMTVEIIKSCSFGASNDSVK